MLCVILIVTYLSFLTWAFNKYRFLIFIHLTNTIVILTLLTTINLYYAYCFNLLTSNDNVSNKLKQTIWKIIGTCNNLLNVKFFQLVCQQRWFAILTELVHTNQIMPAGWTNCLGSGRGGIAVADGGRLAGPDDGFWAPLNLPTALWYKVVTWRWFKKIKAMQYSSLAVNGRSCLCTTQLPFYQQVEVVVNFGTNFVLYIF